MIQTGHRFYDPELAKQLQEVVIPKYMVTPDDKHKFTEGVKLYGKKWVKVSELVGTMTRKQVFRYARTIVG